MTTPATLSNIRSMLKKLFENAFSFWVYISVANTFQTCLGLVCSLEWGHSQVYYADKCGVKAQSAIQKSGLSLPPFCTVTQTYTRVLSQFSFYPLQQTCVWNQCTQYTPAVTANSVAISIHTLIHNCSSQSVPINHRITKNDVHTYKLVSVLVSSLTRSLTLSLSLCLCSVCR